MDPDVLKQNAAAAAAGLVESGMLVGLGTGSTATHAIRKLGERFRTGLRFTGVPTSVASFELARSFGIPLIESPTGTPIESYGSTSLVQVGNDNPGSCGGQLARRRLAEAAGPA